MFSRSRAHILVHRPDAAAVVSALDRWYRRWGHRRLRTPIPDGYPVAPGELQDWYVRSVVGGPAGDWVIATPEDISEALQIAYKAVHTPDPGVAVIVSRAYKSPYGTVEWHLKGYHDRDVLFGHGDDGDHELKWVGRSLETDGIPKAVAALGGDSAIEAFLEGLIAGRPDPRDLEDGLGLPSLAIGFPEVAASQDPAWSRASWVRDDSPLLRR
ncbi:MAG: hypothetical protein ACI9WU_002490 [Myxococcota bacterium]|jgi:hypothetical protein